MLPISKTSFSHMHSIPISIHSIPMTHSIPNHEPNSNPFQLDLQSIHYYNISFLKLQYIEPIQYNILSITITNSPSNISYVQCHAFNSLIPFHTSHYRQLHSYKIKNYTKEYTTLSSLLSTIHGLVLFIMCRLHIIHPFCIMWLKGEL